VLQGQELLGADMSGLEGRCLAHYLAKHDGGRYGDLLLKGDPHWAVVLAIGYLDCKRDKDDQLHTMLREVGAKRLFYAMMYGSGDVKAGRIILEACRLVRKTDPERGGVIFNKFFTCDAPSNKEIRNVGMSAKNNVIAGIEGFDRLKRAIQEILDATCGKDVPLYRRASLPGLDGRRVPIRSEHSALNALLQSAGAILCKRWICDGHDALSAAGFKWGEDFTFVGWIHDEVQVACTDGLGDRIGEVLTAAAREAGASYGFRIALDSAYKLGKTWADTH